MTEPYIDERALWNFSLEGIGRVLAIVKRHSGYIVVADYGIFELLPDRFDNDPRLFTIQRVAP